MKLYDVLAKESTLCFDLLTKKVVMFKNYEQVIPLDVKMEFSYKGENNYEMQ